jgi:tetratricopeptide (TPR) repeat protein
MNLGITSVEQGNYDSAITYCKLALRVYCEINDRLGQGWVLNNLGLILFYLGQYPAAETHLVEALDIHRSIVNRQGESGPLSNLSLISHNLGGDRVAYEYSQQALIIAQEVGDRSTEAEALTHMGHALVGLARPDEAAEAYRQGLAIRRELGEQNMAMESLAGLTRVSLAQGDIVHAREHADEILRYLETGTPSASPGQALDGTYEPFRVYLTCYRVLEADGDARAGEVLTTAYDLLQERAVRIEDEAMRRSFLENVDAHRELIAAWKTR